MTEYLGSAIAPGSICLFGQFGTLIGEPALAFAIEHHVSLKIKPSGHEFPVVDGYKLDPRKHILFNSALQKFWSGEPLEFNTSSQLPMLTGLGTQTALSTATCGLLMALNKDIKKNPTLKKKQHSKALIARKTFSIEAKMDNTAAPVASSTAIRGGVLHQSASASEALWTVKTSDRIWKINPIEIPKDISIVLGFVKQKSTLKQTPAQPRPLFDTPVKAHKPPVKTSKTKRPSNVPKPDTNSVPNKLIHLLGQRGFAKDVLKDVGKITRQGISALKNGDLAAVGNLMNEQLNLIRILGVYPTELRRMVEAATGNSFGVTVSGANCDIVVALTAEPDSVTADIDRVGGAVITTTISEKGLRIKTK
jgi:mevalonate kinase